MDEASAIAGLRADAGRRLLADLAGTDLDAAALPGTIARLREHHPADLVAAGITQTRLRDRARAKFGADAGRMFFTPTGLEQATRSVVAEHRAARFAGAGRVLDLCCGIGGDLIALARAGLQVVGVDADPTTAAVAAANLQELGLGGEVECADATTYSLEGWAAAFCDPDRRPRGRRVIDPRGYAPPLSFLLDLAARVPMTAAKVAPGIPHDLVPGGAEAEWVSDGGDVAEAVLWFGPLATTRRRATLLPGGDTLVAEDAAVPAGAVGRWLYEPDGAVIRAHLVAEVGTRLDARLLDPSIAYLSADVHLPTPFATAYEITDHFAFSLKRLRAVLRERDVGSVTIKKRGSALDPDTLRRQLRLSGSQHCVVVLTRIAGKPSVLLCRPA